MRKIITTLQFVLLLFLCSSFPTDGWPSPEERRVTRYVNCDYGYVVRVPSGLVGRVPEYQNHGFYMNLPDGQSTIEVYNAFNMSESVSPPAVFDYELKFQGEGRAGWRIVSRHSQQVKGLAATSVTATYTYKGAQWKSRSILVYRPEDSEGLGNIVYLFELTTPLERYEETSVELNRTLEGFELTKLPIGPCSND
jgi:hypothetical protein